jgi:Fe-Mn family superoxide dismutase
MNRKEFMSRTAILGGAAFLPANSVFTANLEQNGLDKLTDRNGTFIQSPLPYSENFLEPFMDAETLHLHYTFHHGGATKAANNDIQMIQKLVSINDVETVDYWSKKLAYHLSSHILHSIFWTNLSNKKTDPSGDLLRRIERDFGSYENLKRLIAWTSINVDGNGWCVLAYQPYVQKLVVLQCENHEKLTIWGAIPLIVIDVWEHAYYLKYRNRRNEFVENIFNILDWKNAAERLNIALKLA